MPWWTSSTTRSAHNSLLSPPQKRNTSRDTCSHRSQQHQISFLQLPFLAGGFHRQRDCRCCRISETIDVDNHALGPQAQPLRRCRNDALVGLVGNERLDVATLQTVALEQFFAEFGLLSYGIFEHRLTVLVNVMHLLVYRLMTRRMQTAAAGHVERTTSAAINFVHEVNHSERVVFGRLEHDRSRAVA